MLSRIGTLALTQRKYRRTNLLAATTAATSLAAISASAVVHCSYSQQEEEGKTPTLFLTRTTTTSKQNHHDSVAVDPLSLVIPTLEATMRAIRLVKTSIVIAMDYKLSKALSSNPYYSMITGIIEDNNNKQQEETEEQQRLELLVEQREKEFEEAQLTYASRKSLDPSHNNNDYNKLSPKERKELKTRQKQIMQKAAQRLTEAQEELSTLAASNSNSEVSNKKSCSKKSQLHQRGAQRLLHLCRENGGVYIKVGQHLANLDYILPQEYIDVLSSLFDDTPQSSYEDVARVIQEEFGVRHVSDLFDGFETTPMASASLAQVHVAYDKCTGKKLAIKVQHRGLRETSAGDIFALTTVVRACEQLFPNDFTFGWLADEIAPHLPKELNFRHEGQNAEKAALQLQQKAPHLDCVVPKVLWETTSSRVLTMEFEEGFKSTDLQSIEEAGLNKYDVAKLISSVFNSQVFLSSFVHCDPHPANVLLRNNNGKPQMVLVDHGLYKSIDDSFRIQYAELWRSLMMADLQGIKRACQELGVDNQAYTLFAAMLTARPFDEIIERSKTGSFTAPDTNPESEADRAVIRGYAQEFLKDIFDLLGLLPRQMLLLLKMNDCLRHIDYALGSPTNTLVVAGKYASKAVYENQLQQNQSTSGSSSRIQERFQAWIQYMVVLFRIQLHDFGAWWLLQQRKRIVS